jgi:hypothetical protein
MKMISRERLLIIVTATVLFLASIYILYTHPWSSGGMQVDTFRVKGGWGYQIMVHRKVYIYQPFMPVIPGQHPFPSRKTAARAGAIAMDKLLDGQIPSLSAEDLEHIGVHVSIE